jgi:hypothetical protein
MNGLLRTTVAFVLILSTAACMAPTRFVSVEDASHAERGDQVELVMTDGHEVAGKVGASDARTVEIDTSDGRRSISIERIRSMKRYVYESAPRNNAGLGVVCAVLGLGMIAGFVVGVAALVKSFQNARWGY